MLDDNTGQGTASSIDFILKFLIESKFPEHFSEIISNKKF